MLRYTGRTPLLLPNVEDTKQGIIASKIAAHAADIAKGIPHARDIDDKMADARRVLDWDAQYACALDPETAKAIRDSRKPVRRPQRYLQYVRKILCCKKYEQSTCRRTYRYSVIVITSVCGSSPQPA